MSNSSAAGAAPFDSGHTPGPWYPKTREPLVPGFTIEISDAEYCVAIIPKNKRPDIQVEANARLIAAAPDLLAVLREVAEYLDDRADVEDGHDGKPTPNKAMRLLEEVDAAIAKAEALRASVRQTTDMSAT